MMSFIRAGSRTFSDYRLLRRVMSEGTGLPVNMVDELSSLRKGPVSPDLPVGDEDDGQDVPGTPGKHTKKTR